MDKETAIEVLVEIAEAYLLVNGDDGVIDPSEKMRIETAVETLK